MAESGKSSPAVVVEDATSELERLRARIDAIDLKLLEQLNERARVVLEVGRQKQSRGTEIYSPTRERDIAESLVRRNPGPFPDAGLGPVFREIISATRALEEVLHVAYFGPEGTFTHLAARERFGELSDLVSYGSIEEVFAAVERGKAHVGVVPVENSTEGVVTSTYDALPAHDVSICGEIQLRISLDLVSRTGRIEDVRSVASYIQPLAQCRRWLDRNLPDCERIETASSAVAVGLAAHDDAVAAIGSSIAAEAHGLQTVESAIEDRRDNTTRFLVIGGLEPEPSDNDLTSVVFTIRKDESGALFRLIEPFASRGVNLTSIQLRPIQGKPWEYLFFLDLEGHRAESRVSEALATASTVANSHRILGSFPRASRWRE